MSQPDQQQWTDEQMRQFANDRLTEDMQPAEVWRPGEREIAEARAAGKVLPSETAAR